MTVFIVVQGETHENCNIVEVFATRVGAVICAQETAKKGPFGHEAKHLSADVWHGGDGHIEVEKWRVEPE